jgi:hypothetical protein
MLTVPCTDRLAKMKLFLPPFCRLVFGRKFKKYPMFSAPRVLCYEKTIQSNLNRFPEQCGVARQAANMKNRPHLFPFANVAKDVAAMLVRAALVAYS